MTYENCDQIHFPDLTDHRRHMDSAETYPIYYIYKTVPTEETVSVCPTLAKYLCRRLKYRDCEAGGIWGMSDGIMTHYYHDHYARCNSDHFLPSPDDLNWIIRQWRKVGITFGGIIHCHPANRETPSASDLRYVATLLTFNPQIPSVMLCIITDTLRFFHFERDFLAYWSENMKCGIADE